VKVGDLVKKRNIPVDHSVSGAIGIVVAINMVERHDGTVDSPTVQVQWPGDYGKFWTTTQSLEVVSKA
tara:strand:+ start:1333 stop:1536 length:204 start_codon:yes stop_codon:yes gene_type:complete